LSLTSKRILRMDGKGHDVSFYSRLTFDVQQEQNHTSCALRDAANDCVRRTCYQRYCVILSLFYV